MIELKNLVGDIGDPLDLKLQNGVVYGIMGDEENGASRLLSYLSGARRPRTGEIRINGFSLYGESRRAKACFGYLPPNSPLDGELTVAEQLLFAADVRGMDCDRSVRQIQRSLEQFGLDEKKDTLVCRLEPAEQRFLSLSLALVGDPEILFLDSPTKGLSVRASQMMRNAIRELSERKTVYLSGITPGEVRELCSRVLFFQEGTLTLDTVPSDPQISLLYETLREESRVPQKPRRTNRLKFLFGKSSEEVIDPSNGEGDA